VLAVLVCCGGPLLLLKRATSKVDVADYPNLPDFGEPTSPFPVAQIPVPKFPDLGPATPVGDGGVQTHEIDLAAVQGNEGWPGMKMQMRVYLPPGEHPAKSLPCVLVAPAGATPIMGMPIDDGEYHDEMLPYAEAGMVVVHYSLDGAEDEVFEKDNFVKAAYLRFRASGAGVVDARNALEFALAKLPMVDPKKVFAAGHSSAGTASLLAAAHEPRLAGAVAYAPAADIPKRMEGAEEVPAMLSGLLFPRLNEFLTQSSPMTHAAAIKCPVFLYHAKDDDVVPFVDSERFVAALKTANKDVTFVAGEPGAAAAAEQAADAAGGEAPADDAAAASEGETDEEYSDEEYEDYEDYGFGVHHDSMIKEGMPKGIEWIKSRAGM
jgi:dienelactone hydrolase